MMLLIMLIVPLLISCQSLSWKRKGYDVEFTGMEAKKTMKDLESLSEAWQYRFDTDIDASRLSSMFRGDTHNMTRYLHANGYCEAEVTSRVETGGARPKLIFEISNTNLYRVRDVTIRQLDEIKIAMVGWTNTLTGTVVNFAAIDQAGRQLVRNLKNNGYPYASMVDRTVTIEHEHRVVDVIFDVRAGTPAVMGTHHVQGLRRVETRFVDRKVNWKPGDTYHQNTMDAFSRSLTDSALFSFVDISGPPAASTSEVYDVNIKLQERRRRTIGLGIGYQSDLGPEATVTWQHRNLFGMGERFEIDAKYSEDLWLGSAILTFPDVFHSENDLDLGVDISEEDSDAYDVRYQKVYGKLHQRIISDLFLHYGPAFRNSTVTQLETNENYIHASFPIIATWSTRDDALNPTKGGALTAYAEPFYDLTDHYYFTKALVTPAVYIPLVKEQLSLGMRLTLGSIFGTSAANVPADLRYYAGGGQSIRGYQYQSVGPRENGKLVGGKSLVESSVELRWRFSKSMGVVAFLDGGSSYEPEITDFSESYQWGAGMGFRYFTGVGPIRIDFGVPVNPRDDIDDNFEFYISIGQAF